MKTKNYTNVIVFITMVFLTGLLMGFILGQNLTIHNARPISQHSVMYFGQAHTYD